MIKIRKVTDLEELMRWRAEVIRNVFGVEATGELLEANRSYYRRHVPDGSHLAFVASVGDDGDVGTGALCLSDELPSPDNPSGRCAYLMNIYVREKFRSRGVAKTIVIHLIKEAEGLGCGKIYLESTEMAKSLYSGCGFIDMENMMKRAHSP